MNQDWIPIITLSICFLGLFGVSELLFHFAKIQVEISRKISHIGTGFLTMLFPLWLHSHWSVLLLCGSFFGILLFSQKLGLLQSINGIARQSYGSLSYPIIVYLCFLASEKLEKGLADPPGYSFFYLPILTMALADPAAAFAGMRWPIGRYRIGIDTKSMTGSFAFFGVAFLLALLVLGQNRPLNLVIGFQAMLIGFCAALSEGLSSKGLDNFTIPATVLLLLFFFQFGWVFQ